MARQSGRDSIAWQLALYHIVQDGHLFPLEQSGGAGCARYHPLVLGGTGDVHRGILRVQVSDRRSQLDDGVVGLCMFIEAGG